MIKKLPTLLSYQKNISTSYAIMHETKWKERLNISEPLRIKEMTQICPNNGFVKTTQKTDYIKSGTEISQANIQRSDYCSLSSDNDTLKISFTIKILGNVNETHSCNDIDFYNQNKKIIDLYAKEIGFNELSYRYATNIANGKFGWRNRFNSEKVETNIRINDDKFTFNSLNISTNDFDHKDKDIKKVASHIADVFENNGHCLIHIDSYFKIGKFQDVFPSQCFINDKDDIKGKGRKSKVLFAVDNVAAITSQKIGNAIRTIDTWYPDYNKDEFGAIAINSYGQLQSVAKSFRHGNKKDFYTLFKKLLNEDNISTEDRHFVIANIIMGGLRQEK